MQILSVLEYCLSSKELVKEKKMPGNLENRAVK